ncbi:hypothetical protein Tco_0931082 [Tanacetum coccineum]
MGAGTVAKAADVWNNLREGISLEALRSCGLSHYCSLAETSQADWSRLIKIMVVHEKENGSADEPWKQQVEDELAVVHK